MSSSFQLSHFDCLKTLALVILSNCDLGAAGDEVNLVLVNVIMCEITGGCSLKDKSGRCHVVGKSQSCWQQSAAAVTY